MEMSKLVHLQKFAVGGNKLSGSLPHEICEGGKLTYLSASYNQFSGPITESLTNCTTLVRVNLQGNKFTGNVSEDFVVYPSLQYMDLSNNNLFGELSARWGESSNLTSLVISSNRITGNIPATLGKLKKLEVIDLSLNDLREQIPKELGLLTSLGSLILNGNRVTSVIPQEFGKLSTLENLDLSSNELSGQIPFQLEGCSKLISLNLSRNALGGTIPYQIGNLIYLQIRLDLPAAISQGSFPAWEAKQIGASQSLSQATTFSLALSQLRLKNWRVCKKEAGLLGVMAQRPSQLSGCASIPAEIAAVAHLLSRIGQRKPRLLVSVLVESMGSLKHLIQCIQGNPMVHHLKQPLPLGLITC